MISGGLFQTPPVLTNDNRFATVATNRCLKCYYVETGKLIASVYAHYSPIISLHSHPLFGNRLVSTSKNGIVKSWIISDTITQLKKWDLKSPIYQAGVPKRENQKNLVIFILTKFNKFMQFRRFVLNSSNEYENRPIFEMNELISSREKNQRNIVAFRIANDQRTLVWITKTHLFVFNILEGTKPQSRRISSTTETNLTCLAYHTKTRKVAIGTARGMIRLLTLPSFGFQSSHWHSVAINHVEFSKDGTTLYSGGKSSILLSENLYVPIVARRFVFLMDYPILDFVLSPKLNLYIIRTEENVLYVIHPSRGRRRIDPSEESTKIPGFLPFTSSMNQEKLVSCYPLQTEQKNHLVSLVGHIYRKLQFYDLKEDEEVGNEVLFFRNKTTNSQDKGHQKVPGKVTKLCNISFSRDWFVHAEKVKSIHMLGIRYNIKIWFKQSYSTIRRRRRRNRRNNNRKKKNQSQSKFKIVSVIDQPHDRFAIHKLLVFQKTEKKNRMFISCGKDRTVKVWKFVPNKKKKKKDNNILQSEEEEKKKEKDEEDEEEEEEGIFQCFAILKFKDFIPSDICLSEDETIIFVLFKNYLTIWEITYENQINIKLIYSINTPFPTKTIIKTKTIIPSTSSTTNEENENENEKKEKEKEEEVDIYDLPPKLSMERISNKLLLFYSLESNKLLFFEYSKTCSFLPILNLFLSNKNENKNKSKMIDEETKKKEEDEEEGEVKIGEIVINQFILDEFEKPEFIIVLKNKKRKILFLKQEEEKDSNNNNDNNDSSNFNFSVQEISLEGLFKSNNKNNNNLEKNKNKNEWWVKSVVFTSKENICVMTSCGELINVNIPIFFETKKIEIEENKLLFGKVSDKKNKKNEEDEDDKNKKRRKNFNFEITRRNLMMDESEDALDRDHYSEFSDKPVKFNPERGLGKWKELFSANSHSMSSMSSIYESYMQHFVLSKKK